MTLQFHDYIAQCEDPETGQKHTFRVRAVSDAHAEREARDGWFGLLAPPPKERWQALKVDIARI